MNPATEAVPSIPTVGFNSLPGELRNHIYSYLFPHRHVMLNLSDFNKNTSTLRCDALAASTQRLTKNQRTYLLLTSKKIYNEAICFLYSHVSFGLCIDGSQHDDGYPLQIGLDKIQNLHIMLYIDLCSTYFTRETISRKRPLDPSGGFRFTNITRRSYWVTLSYLDPFSEPSPFEAEPAVSALLRFTCFEELILECRLLERFCTEPRGRPAWRLVGANPAGPFCSLLAARLESSLGPCSQGTHEGHDCLRFRPMDHARNRGRTQS